MNINNNVENWQKQIGYVPQDTFLTDDTIKKNIAFAIPEDKINDEIIKKVIKDAKLDKFVKSLPDNFNTKVGEFGDRLSGGQRQRIAIARSLYNNPKILILDEFTNFLDSSTEKEIINEVNALKGKKTIIMITHRHATLENVTEFIKLTTRYKITKCKKFLIRAGYIGTVVTRYYLKKNRVICLDNFLYKNTTSIDG